MAEPISVRLSIEDLDTIRNALTVYHEHCVIQYAAAISERQATAWIIEREAADALSDRLLDTIEAET